MISYREELHRIGVTGPSVSYRDDFTSRPASLRAALASMRAPKSEDWRKVHEVALKSQNWTEKCNGVTWDDGYFIFASNSKNDIRDKALYSFREAASLADEHVVNRFQFYGNVGREIDHIGQLTSFDGKLYVSHFEGNRSCIFVLTHGEDGFVFERSIDLPLIEGRKVEFLAINPWDRKIYTAWGNGLVDRVFIHDLDEEAGRYTGRFLALGRGLKEQAADWFWHTAQYPIQGGFFSNNGHLYIASNVEFEGTKDQQPIFYFSALNGHLMGVLAIDAVRSKMQELEGPCCIGSQVCVVLAETNTFSKDDVFFKQYEAATPSLV